MKILSISIFVSALLITGAVLYSSGAFKVFSTTPEWKQHLLMRLSDPESAKFRNVVTNEITNWTCGSVNARNLMGGYTGWTKFAIMPPSAFEEFERPNWKVIFENDYAAVVDICG